MDNDVTDIIGNKTLYGGIGVDFVSDRFNSTNSAINFNHGFYQAPPGQYFNGDFTISVWIKLNNKSIVWPRIIDFGNSKADAIYFSIANASIFTPVLYTSANSTSSLSITSRKTLNLGKWYNLVATLNETNARIYIDSSIVAEGSIYRPAGVNRLTNYVGKSNWNNNDNLCADLDELRIYNRSLTESEILELFNLDQTDYSISSTAETTTGLITTSNFGNNLTECLEFNSCVAFIDNGTNNFDFFCEELCNYVIC